jgi:hypothetical protein
MNWPDLAEDFVFIVLACGLFALLGYLDLAIQYRRIRPLDDLPWLLEFLHSHFFGRWPPQDTHDRPDLRTVSNPILFIGLANLLPVLMLVHPGPFEYHVLGLVCLGLEALLCIWFWHVLSRLEDTRKAPLPPDPRSLAALPGGKPVWSDSHEPLKPGNAPGPEIRHRDR